MLTPKITVDSEVIVMSIDKAHHSHIKARRLIL